MKLSIQSYIQSGTPWLRQFARRRAPTRVSHATRQNPRVVRLGRVREQDYQKHRIWVRLSFIRPLSWLFWLASSRLLPTASHHSLHPVPRSFHPAPPTAAFPESLLAEAVTMHNDAFASCRRIPATLHSTYPPRFRETTWQDSLLCSLGGRTENARGIVTYLAFQNRSSHETLTR